MTDAISLALQTGLGPVVAIVIILALMGLTYKIAGKIPALISGVVSTFALTFLDFLPIYWALGIIFAIIAGMIVGGEKLGD